ncbi:hypothetical protein INT45_002741 [Circinella minor]|uniref:RNI-like protein n=1 Tax=Circinella minor TaxID=1195481 RepID=A0A8H7S3Z8_9FUNG|nr:hypothetical protein INT45_002741 [Circinella minor]
MVDNSRTTTTTTLSSSSPSSSLTSTQLIKLTKDVLKIEQKLKNTIKNQDYQETITYASEVADKLIPLIQLILYDTRAHAYSMQGQFEQAIQDTQRMIGQSPTVAAGYLRKATVFSMYGKQIQAIEAYDEGIQRREKAVATNEKCVDFFPLLAVEIADNIVSRLSQATRLTCLTLSKEWLKKMKECRDGWQSLYIDNNRDDIKLLSLLPHISYYTRYLVIDTSYGTTVNPLYLTYMRNERFSKIESIKITALTTNNFQPYSGMLIVALWQTRQTLTTLDLDMGNTNANAPTLADILSICIYLTNLVYLNHSTTSTSSLMGDLTTIKDHKTLVNLQLKLEVISKASLQALIARCLNLRRLVMNGCDGTALEIMNTHSEKLEIIGFNSNVPVPQLQRATIHDNNKNKTELRSFYIDITCGANMSLQISQMLNIMHKSQATLETVYISAQNYYTARNYIYFQLSPPSLSFKRLKNMTFCPFHSESENILLTAVAKSPCFTELSTINMENVDKFVNISINIPPLLKLRICQNDVSSNRDPYYHGRAREDRYYSINRDYRTAKQYAYLSRLFQHYARISTCQNSLESIIFDNCFGMKGDVLLALSGIKTLHEITLHSLHHIDTTHIISVITSLAKQLTFVDFLGMDSITNSILATLSGSHNLNYVKLESLSSITSQGIRDLVDSLKHRGALKNLTIVKCDQISHETITYASQQISCIQK